MYNFVMSASTSGNPEAPKTQQFSAQPPPVDAFLTASYAALQAAGISRQRARDDAGPTYITVDSERRAAGYNDDYKPAVTMSQLMPLHTTRHLHPSISAYQHQLQQQQQQQQSSYIKTENATCEQSHAQGKCDCMVKCVFSR